jgi:hypothetical protein
MRSTSSTTSNYAFLIRSSIPAVHRVADARRACGVKVRPYMEVWFQPRISDLVSGYLVEFDLAPASMLRARSLVMGSRSTTSK